MQDTACHNHNNGQIAVIFAECVHDSEVINPFDCNRCSLYGGSEGQNTTNAHTPFLRTNHNAVFCQMLWFDPEGLEHKIKKNDIQ